MSVIDFPTPPDWLKKYYERNFRLIFYPTKQKGPSGQEALGWTERSDQATDWRDGRNVGVFLGTEISPGKFLTDVDFDWTDGIPLAKRLLPSTKFGFGRASRPISHAFYTTPEPLVSMSFDNIDGKTFVEIRGTKQDGTIGMQTMLPPSIHPSGEDIVIKYDEEIGHSENLIREVTLYAVACMLYSQFPNHQLLHDTRLAVSGFLLGEGLSQEEVINIVAGVAEQSGNNVQDAILTVKTSAQRLKANEPVQGKSTLIKAIGDNGKAVIARIKEWIGGGDFIEDSKGKVLANNQENVKRAIDKLDISLSFDVFAQKPLIDYPADKNGNSYSGALIDPVVVQSWLEVDTKFHFRPSKDFFYDVMQNRANTNKFHPVLDYLRGLKWDFQPRLEEWIIQSGKAQDSLFNRAVSKIMLLAAVKRVTEPGCKYDEMVVLESSVQGLLKSTALRTLCPNPKWFSDDLPLNVDAKQIVERTLGKWIIEASDLSGMHPSQVEHLKGMLSRQSDGPVRLAYGRLPVEQPRQFIIAGTTNAKTYLTDSTGGRRFWPIEVNKFDIPWIATNRDQLWAEAYAREQGYTDVSGTIHAPEGIRLDPELYPHAALQQEKRRAEDPWEQKFFEVFRLDQKYRLTADQVWGYVGVSIDKQSPQLHDRMLKAMHKIGFRRMAVRNEEGLVVKGFGRDIEEGQLKIPE